MINNSSNNNKTNNYLSPQTIEHKTDLHIYGMYFHVSGWHTSQTSFNKYMPPYYLNLPNIYFEWKPHNLMHWQKAWFLVIVMLF